ncbi:hypothetical protein BDFB_004835, partial [Asbolus verrucosus]
KGVVFHPFDVVGLDGLEIGKIDADLDENVLETPQSIILFISVPTTYSTSLSCKISGVMAWDAISYGSLSTLVFIERSSNGNRCIENVFEPVLTAYVNGL